MNTILSGVLSDGAATLIPPMPATPATPANCSAMYYAIRRCPLKYVGVRLKPPTPPSIAMAKKSLSS